VTPSAVLFDFDGTLADTAPDLAAAVNQLRAEHGMERLSNEAVRPYASMGARGLLRIGFGLTPDDADYPALRDAFLERYAERVCVDTRLFPGMAELLRELESRDIAWGIVTAIFIVLFIWRGVLSSHEDDQIFLDAAEEHMARHQRELVAKIMSLSRPLLITGILSGVLLLLAGGLWIYEGFKQNPF